MIDIFGSIIAIAVSVAVILIFRQIDKDSRSLEKVKKYADKIRSDLDVYFNEQKEKLDTVAVNLKVEQQKAMATISRLDMQYDEFEKRSTGLEDRTNAVDTIHKRITDYDNQLNELVEMTARLEENLQSLRKESSFVSNLAKKLDSQKNQLEFISKKIPAIQSEFDQVNKTHLEQITAESTSHFNDVVKNLATSTDEAIHKNEELLEQINQSISQAYKSATEKANSLEDATFSSLNEKAIARENQFIKLVSDRIQSLEKNIASQLEDFQEKVTSSKETYDEEVQRIEDSFSEYQADARRASERFDVELSNAESVLSELKNTLAEKTDEISAHLDEVLEKAAGNSLELGAKAQESFTARLSEKLSSLASQTQKALDDAKATTESALLAFQEKTNDSIVTIQSQTLSTLQDFQEKTDSSVSTIQAQAVNSLHEIQEKTQSNIQNTEQNLLTSLTNIREQLSLELKRLESFADSSCSDWEQKRNSIIDLHKSDYEQIQKYISDTTNSLNQKFVDFQNEISANTSDIENKTQENRRVLDELQNEVDTKTAEIVSRMDSVFENAAQRVSEMEEGAYKQFENQSLARRDSFKSDSERKFQELSSFISDGLKQITTEFAQKSDEANSLIESYEQSWEKQAATILSDFNATVAKNLETYDQAVQNIENRFKTYELESSSQAENIASSIASNKKTFSDLKQSFQEELSVVSNKIHVSLNDALSIYQKESTDFFADMEKQLESFKSDMAYRYQRLDEATEQLDNLDANLRKAMGVTEEKVHLDFQSFISNQQMAQNDFEKTILATSDKISEHIHGLEGELDELKKRAYDNVSEKLKIFEDDFATDLSKRTNEIDISFASWKSAFDTRLESVALESEQERKVIETEYNENLKKMLSSLQDRSRDQISRFEEAISSSNENIRIKIESCDNSLRGFVEQYRTDLDNAKISADAFLKKEMEIEGHRIDEQLAKFQRDIVARLDSFDAQVSESHEKSDNVLKDIMNDFTSWQERLNVQFDESKNMFSSKLENMKQYSTELISQVQTSFDSDVEGFKTKSLEERQKLVEELEELKTNSVKTISDYESRSIAMIDEFKKLYDNMVDDTERRLRDQGTDTEQKLRILRQLVQDIREKNEESQEKMVLKMQNDANKLNSNMDDLETRLQQFIAQTRIFDKAEEMKAHLENQLESLKIEISKVESFREDAKNVEQQFARIYKLEDDLTQKLQRFNEEKKHLDELETDFTKLVALSDSMDSKILEMQTSNDDIQSIQSQLRSMMKTVNDGAVKFERLEKKIPVLDQTTIDVDQSFESLKKLENRLASCASQTEEIPSQLNNVRRDIQQLLDSSARVGDVVAKLESLDSILAQTEKRITEVEKSRDLIVRTESRLEEISRQAESEVKLIGELTKSAQSRHQESARGAPSTATRENVIKLLHQGWKPDEIARSLNLTLGEVELIQDFHDRSDD